MASGGISDGGAPSTLRQFVEIALYPLRFAKFWIDTARLTPKASLYYLHSFEQFPAVWFKALRFHVPYVYDAHDMYSVLRHDGRPRPIDTRVEERIRDAVERRCVRHAAAVVTVAEGVADLQEEAFGRRPFVVRNAHDRRLDEETGPACRASSGLGSDTFLLAVSGNLKRGMALRQLLRALLDLPEQVHLMLIGAGYRDLDQEIEELELSPRVHSFAPLPPTQIVPFLRSADVAPVIYQPLNTSLRSALPNGFFHAIAAGLPVLYPSDLPELRSIVEAHGCGLPIEPSDPGSVADVVVRLLGDSAELGRLRAAAAQAREGLSWECEEVKLAEIMATLMPDGGRR